jgi:hypothetical protein
LKEIKKKKSKSTISVEKSEKKKGGKKKLPKLVFFGLQTGLTEVKIDAHFAVVADHWRLKFKVTTIAGEGICRVGGGHNLKQK